MKNIRAILPLVLVGVVLIALPTCASHNAPGASTRLRILVSSDIGGTDPDDFQSMVHLFLYADMFNVFNSNSVTAIEVDSSAAYNNIFWLVSPRVFRLGLGFDF